MLIYKLVFKISSKACSGLCRGLTFKKLLASVFLEKRVMNYRASKVINHEMHNRVKLLLGVAGVVRDGIVLNHSVLVESKWLIGFKRFR